MPADELRQTGVEISSKVRRLFKALHFRPGERASDFRISNVIQPVIDVAPLIPRDGYILFQPCGISFFAADFSVTAVGWYHVLITEVPDDEVYQVNSLCCNILTGSFTFQQLGLAQSNDLENIVLFQKEPTPGGNIGISGVIYYSESQQIYAAVYVPAKTTNGTARVIINVKKYTVDVIP